jgi:hypothetical protein
MSNQLNIPTAEYVSNNNPVIQTELTVGANYFNFKYITDVEDIAAMLAIGDSLLGGNSYKALGEKFLAAPLLGDYLTDNQYDATNFAAYIINDLAEMESMRTFNYS